MGVGRNFKEGVGVRIGIGRNFKKGLEPKRLKAESSRVWGEHLAGGRVTG